MSHSNKNMHCKKILWSVIKITFFRNHNENLSAKSFELHMPISYVIYQLT